MPFHLVVFIHFDFIASHSLTHSFTLNHVSFIVWRGRIIQTHSLAYPTLNWFGSKREQHFYLIFIFSSMFSSTPSAMSVMLIWKMLYEQYKLRSEEKNIVCTLRARDREGESEWKKMHDGKRANEPNTLRKKVNFYSCKCLLFSVVCCVETIISIDAWCP